MIYQHLRQRAAVAQMLRELRSARAGSGMPDRTPSPSGLGPPPAPIAGQLTGLGQSGSGETRAGRPGTSPAPTTSELGGRNKAAAVEAPPLGGSTAGLRDASPGGNGAALVVVGISGGEGASVDNVNGPAARTRSGPETQGDACA